MRVISIPKVGDVFKTSQGCEVQVLEYVSSNKIRVKFLDSAGHEKYVANKELKKGAIKNPFHPQVHGIGFFGVGPHVAMIGPERTKEYTQWSSMLTRCYYGKYHERFPTYVGCRADEQWHNYQEFAEWCNWQIGFKEGYVLDKDILVKGNKVYSPETCVFVPAEINSLFVCMNKKGKTSPAGISYQESYGKYIVSCAIRGKNKNLGRYKCPEEAFAVYKNFKENLVKEKAEEYKDVLDVRAYHALMNFEV